MEMSCEHKLVVIQIKYSLLAIFPHEHQVYVELK